MPKEIWTKILGIQPRKMTNIKFLINKVKQVLTSKNNILVLAKKEFKENLTMCKKI